MSEERLLKHEQSRARLPGELKSVFDALVKDYEFAAQIHYRTVLVSCSILAVLAPVGRRPPASQSRKAREFRLVRDPTRPVASAARWA
ncbi:MAG: hypothetical protein AB7T19_02355 [Planctomycetota bacterium]